ncbi:hypothetical protein U1Q18_042451 [Sarracenia purpurea var. burkii]
MKTVMKVIWGMSFFGGIKRGWSSERSGFCSGPEQEGNVTSSVENFSEIKRQPGVEETIRPFSDAKGSDKLYKEEQAFFEEEKAADQKRIGGNGKLFDGTFRTLESSSEYGTEERKETKKGSFSEFVEVVKTKERSKRKRLVAAADRSHGDGGGNLRQRRG